MNNKKKNHPRQQSRAAAVSGVPSSGKGRLSRGFSPRAARWLTYGVGFVVLYAFLVWGYGDVLMRAEQESYISSSPDTMYYLTSQPFGHVYALARWVLVLFKWAALGGVLLAGMWSLTARLADYAFRVPRRWEGVGFLLPLLQMGWIAWRGTNLYYNNEPSLFLLVAFAVLLVAALLALGAWLITRKWQKAVAPVSSVRPWGGLAAWVVIAASWFAVCWFNQNEIYTARMQRLQESQQWDEMIDLAKQARRPSRAVAAYYACALEETDQLLNGLFDIPYEFPRVRLDSLKGTEEYGLFLPDCSFHAGVVNASYRTAMDKVVCTGPRLCYFKRMAVCALLNNEPALCRKYLALIDAVPFEHAFVERYAPMVANRKLIEEDAELKHVLSLAPMENNFEQNYRTPLFLGYNMGISRGTDASLVTSAAACLYSKDLQAFLPRAQVLAQKGLPFPQSLQQAICILALKNPDLLDAFPQVNNFVANEVTSFLLDAKPYAKDRLALRHNLRDKWLGSYMYYYYTENNDPDQLMRPKESGANAQVN